MLPEMEANPVAGNGSAVRRSVVSKVAVILRTFRFGGAFTVTEIAQLTELPLSTAHRLVVELADWQLLRRGDDGLARTDHVAGILAGARSPSPRATPQ